MYCVPPYELRIGGIGNFADEYAALIVRKIIKEKADHKGRHKLHRGELKKLQS